MFGFVVVIHILICIFLSLIILMQSGRGGGLTEQFAAAESMFGAKTNVVLVKATTVLAGIFIVTCLSLAFLSARSSKSLITDKKLETSGPTQTKSTSKTANDAAIPVPSENIAKDLQDKAATAVEAAPPIEVPAPLNPGEPNSAQ